MQWVLLFMKLLKLQMQVVMHVVEIYPQLQQQLLYKIYLMLQFWVVHRQFV